MILKWIFDRLVSFIGLCFLCRMVLLSLFRNELDVVVSFLIVINSAQ